MLKGSTPLCYAQQMPLVLIPEVEATHSSKASVNCYQTTHHITFHNLPSHPKILGLNDGDWDCLLMCNGLYSIIIYLLWRWRHPIPLKPGKFLPLCISFDSI